MPREETQFKPGESGNPAGRPKGPETWAALYDRLLRETSEEHPELTKKEAAALTHIKHCKNDPRFAKLIQERTEGKVPDKIEIEGLTINVTPSPKDFDESDNS